MSAPTQARAYARTMPRSARARDHADERMLHDRRVRAADLAELPDHVRTSAVVLDNGEVLWPFDTATDAINELARLNRVVLGVDARERDDSGLVTEVPLSIYEPSGSPADVDRGRDLAIAAVG